MLPGNVGVAKTMPAGIFHFRSFRLHLVGHGAFEREEKQPTQQRQEGSQIRHQHGTACFLPIWLEGHMERWREGYTLSIDHGFVIPDDGNKDADTASHIQNSCNRKWIAEDIPLQRFYGEVLEYKDNEEQPHQLQDAGRHQEVLTHTNINREQDFTINVRIAKCGPLKVGDIVVNADFPHSYIGQARFQEGGAVHVPHSPLDEAQAHDGQDPSYAGDGETRYLAISDVGAPAHGDHIHRGAANKHRAL